MPLLFVFIIFCIVALVLALIYFTARLLVSLATDRELPRFFRSDKALSVITKSESFADYIVQNSKRLEKEMTEQVEITGYGGIRLVGHIQSAKEPKRVLIAAHGWRGSWSRDFGIISDFWNRSDSTVIYVEQRAVQSSDGEYITFGICERYDILEWVRWAAKRYVGLPIYLCGISMGASCVLMSAGLELDSAVHGIIADSGFTSPNAIWKYVVRRNLHLPYSLYRRIADRLCKKRTGFGAEDCSTILALRNCQIPVLFIHGGQDSFVPVEMTYENYRVCPSPKRLFIVPEANHGMSYFVDKVGYEREMTGFWNRYD